MKRIRNVAARAWLDVVELAGVVLIAAAAFITNEALALLLAGGYLVARANTHWFRKGGR